MCILVEVVCPSLSIFIWDSHMGYMSVMLFECMDMWIRKKNFKSLSNMFECISNTECNLQLVCSPCTHPLYNSPLRCNIMSKFLVRLYPLTSVCRPEPGDGSLHRFPQVFKCMNRTTVPPLAPSRPTIRPSPSIYYSFLFGPMAIALVSKSL